MFTEWIKFIFAGEISKYETRYLGDDYDYDNDRIDNSCNSCDTIAIDTLTSAIITENNGDNESYCCIWVQFSM